MSLSGQWITRYDGNNTGTLVIDLDDVGDHYEGVACAWDANPDHPNSWSRIVTPSKANAHRLERVPVQSIDNIGNALLPYVIERLKANGMFLPDTADIEFDLQNHNLSVKWTTPVQSFGAGVAVAPKTRAGQRSELKTLSVRSWEGFKKYVNNLDRKRYIFRGQEDSEWRLRTSFFRTGRANLERYSVFDIGDLHKTLRA